MQPDKGLLEAFRIQFVSVFDILADRAKGVSAVDNAVQRKALFS
jgi:hypothetical protein